MHTTHKQNKCNKNFKNSVTELDKVVETCNSNSAKSAWNAQWASISIKRKKREKAPNKVSLVWLAYKIQKDKYQEKN